MAQTPNPKMTEQNWSPSGSTPRAAISPSAGADTDNALMRLWRAWQVASPSTAPKDISAYCYKGKHTLGPVGDRVYARAAAMTRQHPGLHIDDALVHVLRREPLFASAMAKAHKAGR
jgi:hypothetical protein